MRQLQRAKRPPPRPALPPPNQPPAVHLLHPSPSFGLQFAADHHHPSVYVHRRIADALAKQIAVGLTRRAGRAVTARAGKRVATPLANPVLREWLPPLARTVSFLSDPPSLTSEQFSPLQRHAAGKAAGNRCDRQLGAALPVCGDAVAAVNLRFILQADESLHAVLVGPAVEQATVTWSRGSGAEETLTCDDHYKGVTTRNLSAYDASYYDGWCWRAARSAQPARTQTAGQEAAVLRVCSRSRGQHVRWVVAVVVPVSHA